jgi:elongation factor Ts
MDVAIKSLREKGLAKAAKKSDRTTKEGRVITAIEGKKAVILELNCETDFVANNNNFISLGKTIATALTGSDEIKLDEIKSLNVNGSTVGELISDAVLQLGENINVGQFNRFETDGQFSNYEHSNGKIGVLVEFSNSVEETVGRDIAMQVAAMNPPYVSSDQVPASDLDAESEILRKQALSEGKPEKVVDKIIEGRIAKFYKENCLVEQEFVKDSNQQIKDLLPENTAIRAFKRFSLVN